ncbi:RagB/SusD family nutrient uptake outer membrane protein [Paraflavitalea sp. CAU 1676]|uniref:RagB/SusD family nutrient uptake outer membrane protein n=1 Tax=Paraflavitalea sp. CAU 1676 TaxID=3032598 RepID=UPI0023DC9651|nr:RagB/SusD family nutrient uptake outer membrane protein [Paraflavitalea sp. CAU 1676]MDF2189058.1 RagB/SusD family nutrient uptake outer membrane protein [Paraflavitalea sp. CAU 1676]
MKQTTRYIRNISMAALSAITLLPACRKELDKSPLYQFANETFWTSEGNAVLALNGVYRGNIQMNQLAEFSATDWWSYHGLLYLEFATDNAYDRRGDNSAMNRLSNGTLTADNSYLSNYWNASYSRVARCNYFLENVAKTPVSEAKLKRFTAEARFIRACQYFYMSQYWQSVPLVTKTLSLQEANTVTKASKQDLVNFVTTELKAVAADLPQFKDIPSSERGRASKQAALAFLGRLQLAEKKYADAAATYKTIIDFNDNIIDADFEGLFNSTNENSKEIIFATQYIQDLAGNGILQHDYPAMVGGWHLYCPLGSLVESFEFTDGTTFSYTDARYNAVDLGASRDPRLKYTVLYNQQSFRALKYITHPDSAKSADQLTTTKQATRTGFGLKKFNFEGFAGGNLQNSGIDLPIIRYAEVLLSYLEAKLENGDAIDQALLDATINKVRGRASVNMPKVTETDATNLRSILRRERRNELACEGVRYWDLLRWGIAPTVLNGDFYGAPYPTAVNLRKKGTTIDPWKRWYVTSKTFRAGTDEKWPIPQSEQNINPNLK